MPTTLRLLLLLMLGFFGLQSVGYAYDAPVAYVSEAGYAVTTDASSQTPNVAESPAQALSETSRLPTTWATSEAIGQILNFVAAKSAPLAPNKSKEPEYIYGPKDDPKVNPDGSTSGETWTTPDDYPGRKEATDKLDPFKPVEGRRPVNIPEGQPVQRGITPGGEGPYNGSGGANETRSPGGLPPGSVGPFEPLPASAPAAATS